MTKSDKQIELTPPQPPAVAEAIALALDDPAPPVDPWWQAGLEEGLDAGPPG